MKPIVELSGSLRSRSDLKKETISEAVFLVSDGVSGYISLEISSGASKCDEFLVEIQLTGHSKVSMTWQEVPDAAGVPASFVERRKILDLVQRMSLPRENTKVSQANIGTRFHFPLGRKAEKNGSCVASSLDHKSPTMPGWNNLDPMTAASVTYELRFRFYHRSILLNDLTRKIHIFDCKSIAPPVCVEDFGSEYNLNTVISLRRNIFQKSATMAISSAQPGPFVFNADIDTATTGIPIRVSLRRGSEANELVGRPGKLEVDVSWRLQTSTFVSKLPLTGQPTASQAVKLHSLVCLVGTDKVHRQKTYWSNWSPRRPSNKSSVDRGIEYTTDGTIWLSLQSSLALTPTTSLRCISRRYCILLEMQISGFGRSSSALRIPIQIVYQSQQACIPQDTAAPGLGVLSSQEHIPYDPSRLQDHRPVLPPYTANPCVA